MKCYKINVQGMPSAGATKHYARRNTDLVTIGRDLQLILRREVLVQRLVCPSRVAHKDLERSQLVVVERAVVAVHAKNRKRSEEDGTQSQ